MYSAWSEKFVASAARRCSPVPLCDALDCVHLHNEGLHCGLLSRRGPVVLPTLLGVSILSSGSDLKIFVTFTRYFSSRVVMNFSLVIVTCFAMSFALRSDATARLVLDVSLLHCTRVAIPTILNFADWSFCWMRNSVFSFLFAAAQSFCSVRPLQSAFSFSLRCTVILLHAAV